MIQSTAQLAVLSVELHFPASNSLKEKRRILKSIKDRVRSRFNVSIAEIDFLDKWQRAVLGICMIGNDRSYIDGHLQHVLSLMEQVPDAQVTGQELQFL